MPGVATPRPELARRHDRCPDGESRIIRTPGSIDPTPCAHLVRYHGLLAPCASGRDRIVPGAESKPPPLAVRAGMEKTRVERSEPKEEAREAGTCVQGQPGAAVVPLTVGAGSKGTEQGARRDGWVPNSPSSSTATEPNAASQPPTTPQTAKRAKASMGRTPQAGV